MVAASCCTRNVVGIQSHIHQDVVRVVSLRPQMASRREDLRAGSTARRREDLRAGQNKTRGYRCGSTGSRKRLNQRKWKGIQLGCLAAHGEQMDESGQQTYMVKGTREDSFVRRDILSRKDPKIGSAISLARQSSRDKDLRTGSIARRREDLRASQNKTRGYC